ncbi:MAG: DUF3822 family protein [Bacteroidetes bacterium]|nr:DUF3822 family protein [Bacteroidota bacterium]
MPAENQTVQPSFNITPVAITDEKPVLLIHAGRQGISIAWYDEAANTFTGIQVYHFPSAITDEAIAAEADQVFNESILYQQHFRKIFLSWCFEESILVPTPFFDNSQSAAMLQLVYGDVAAVNVQHELVLSQSLQNIYSIPAAVKNVFAHHFPFCIQGHINACLVNIEKEQRDLLYTIFSPGRLTVVLRNENRLQVIQQFMYSTPVDAVYHLLNTCQSYQVNTAEIPLVLSGMIDANSNLYNEVYKYFLNISFASLPGNFSYADTIKEQPVHYFSHLFATALCVL